MLSKIWERATNSKSETSNNLLAVEYLRKALIAQNRCNVIKTLIGGKIREALVHFSPELSAQGKVELFAYENLLDISIYYKKVSAKSLLAEMDFQIDNPLKNTETEIFALTKTNINEED